MEEMCGCREHGGGGVTPLSLVLLDEVSPGDIHGEERKQGEISAVEMSGFRRGPVAPLLLVASCEKWVI